MPKKGNTNGMDVTLNPALTQLFGGETRTKVLGLLANSLEPKTGYELSKALGASASKVYGVLRGLEGTGLLGAIPDKSNSKRYYVADEDLKRFLLKRVRIMVEEDWLAPRAVEEREKLLRFANQVRIEIPKAGARPGNLFNRSEFIRPAEKDWALERVSGTSRRDSGTTSRRRRK